MNRFFFSSWALILMIWVIGSFIVHGGVLQDEYHDLAALLRSEEDAEQQLPYLLLAYVLQAGAFVWIYQRGVGTQPWYQQGLRYGVVIALLTVVPNYLAHYALQPVPGLLAIKQILLDGLVVVLLGLTISYLYRLRMHASHAGPIGQVPR